MLNREHHGEACYRGPLCTASDIAAGQAFARSQRRAYSRTTSCSRTTPAEHTDYRACRKDSLVDLDLGAKCPSPEYAALVAARVQRRLRDRELLRADLFLETFAALFFFDRALDRTLDRAGLRRVFLAALGLRGLGLGADAGASGIPGRSVIVTSSSVSSRMPSSFSPPSSSSNCEYSFSSPLSCSQAIIPP